MQRGAPGSGRSLPGGVAEKPCERFQSVGLCQDAKPLSARALSIVERSARGSNPKVEKFVRDLRDVPWHLGDFDAARYLYERSRALPEIAFYRNGLASLVWEMGGYVEAFLEYSEALQITGAALGGEDLEVANLKNNLGNLLPNVEDYTKPEHDITGASALRERVLDEYHIDMARPLHNLAASTCSCGISI